MRLLVIATLLLTVATPGFLTAASSMEVRLCARIERRFGNNETMLARIDRRIFKRFGFTCASMQGLQVPSNMTLQPAADAAKPSVQLLDVIDGDTIEVRLQNGETEKVRIIGLDAPEQGECFYNESTAHLEQLLSNNEIDLQTSAAGDDIDRYNRLLRYVHANGTDAGISMIQSGHAKSYRSYPHDRTARYNALEAQAQLAESGLWGTCESNTANEPVDYEGPCPVKGNINSRGDKLYHTPSCPSYNSTKISPHKGEQCFATAREAEAAGWVMAGNCS